MEQAGIDADAQERAETGGGQALPVLAGTASPVLEATPQTPARLEASLPAVQAAAVAAGGFVAGAAVAGLVRRRRGRPAARTRRGLLRRARRGEAGRGKQSGGSGELLQIIASRSLLVDVHLLGVPGRNADA